jgi:hypothetical protein
MSALHFLNETHAEDYDSEPDYYQMLDLRAENERLKASVREMVGRMADRGIVERAYEALGEPKPPMRKLKGKIPRYQQELIDRGELEV